MPSTVFRILGPLEVAGPAGAIGIRSARQRAILAALILRAGETVASERLIEDVWGDNPPPSARHTLAVHVSCLRRAIGTDCIETRPTGYRLRSAAIDVDLQRFEALIAQGSAALGARDARRAADDFAAALSLWRGPALADLDGLAARAESARLSELRTLALEGWIDASLASGRHVDVIPELRRVVAEMPLQEAFSARLMLALYRSGRQGDALDVYLEARETLDRELGVEPGDELEELQRAILVHDPALSIAPVAPPLPPFSRLDGTGDAVGSEWTSSAGMSPLVVQARIESRPGDLGDPRPETIESRSARGNTRRTVTVLVASARGTTSTGTSLDRGAARHAEDRWFEEMRAILERHGGTVQKVVDAGLLAVFGVPLAHEDDALRAVRGASEMRGHHDALNERLGQEVDVRTDIRVGIDTGEVVVASGLGVRVAGEAVDAATRLHAAADPGEILLGRSTHRLVAWAVDAEPASAREARGKSGSAGGARLLQVIEAVGAHPQKLDSPLVGRTRERHLIDSVFRQVVADEACHLFSLLGAAGVGKSRLVHEFVRSVRSEAQVLRGRCPAYGDRVAFWPIIETIRQAAAIRDADPPDAVELKIAALVRGDPEAAAIAGHMSAILGVSQAPCTGEEAAWAVRRTFEAVALTRPLVIVIDDVHWAEPSLLDLVECLAETSRGVPILVVCVARPELLEVRPHWAGGKLNATSILLGPLARGEVMQLIGNLLGSRAPEAVEDRVVEAAEGNPLFVEEFVTMLLEDQLLVRTGGEWAAAVDVEAIATPASIMALLTARLDRLPDDEREVLERASVVGKAFSREAVDALTERGAIAGLGPRLATLVQKELVRPDRPSPNAPDSWRFKHILIRDAAYAGLSKRERAELHERFADFREGAPGRRPSEQEEVIGYHLEQAAQYRQQLGLADERTGLLARRAAELLGAAGVRAIQRGDALASNRLLERCREMWQLSKRRLTAESSA